MTKGPASSEAARLAAIKAAECEAARQHILEGELDEAFVHVRKAEIVERLARLVDKRSRPPVLAMTLVGVCVSLVFAAWKLRAATFTDLEVSIHGETTAARLTLARPARFEPFRGTSAELGRLSALAAQIGDVPRTLTGDGWVRVQGGPVEVRGFRAAARAELAFALVAGPGAAPALSLRAHARGVEGELLVRPGALMSSGATGRQAAPGNRLAGDVLDVVSFGCDDCMDAPFRLDLPGVDPFTFGNVPVSQLAFAVEEAQPDGTIYFTSGLRSGSIRLLDADRAETIQVGDNLKLDIARPRRFAVGRTAKQDVLSFVYEGTVKSISLGPLNAERDLSPSVLELFYRQKAFALLWGAGVFLWGLLMGIRRLWQGRSG